VGDLIDEVGLTGVARTLVAGEEIRDDYCVPPGELSLLFHLHFDRLMWNQSESGTEAFRVRGGADRIPRALAEGLDVRLGSPVDHVEQDSNGVKVSAGSETFTGDHCVLAAPLPALRRVEMTAPKRVAEAIDRVQYGTGTKNLLLFKRSFWRERGLTGDTLTDLPLGTTWEATNRVLISYAVGKVHSGVRPLSARSCTQGSGPSVQLERIYPGSRRLFERGETIAWEDEPYSGGTYTAFAPGQVTRYWEALREPFGRVHLAGEHTSLYTGYMEGAVRSGKRVADAIEKAAKR
jgi:monoamine oxidase